MRNNRLLQATWALLVIQVIHGAIPADTDAEGYVGLVAGLIAVIASITAIVGITRGASWGPRLAAITGGSVAIGFLLYHALPIHSDFTNPYFGEDKIGLAQWLPVIACIGIGAWCVWEYRRSTTPAMAPAR